MYTCKKTKQNIFLVKLANAWDGEKRQEHGKCLFKPILCVSAGACCVTTYNFAYHFWMRSSFLSPRFPRTFLVQGSLGNGWWWRGWMGVRGHNGWPSGVSDPRMASRWLWEQGMTNAQIMSPGFSIQEALKMQHCSFWQWIKWTTSTERNI